MDSYRVIITEEEARRRRNWRWHWHKWGRKSLRVKDRRRHARRIYAYSDERTYTLAQSPLETYLYG